MDLATDTVTLQDGPIFDSGMAATAHPSINDVTRDGRRLVIILAMNADSSTIITTDPGCPECPATVGSAGGGASLSLKISEDLGATWKALPFPWEMWQGQYGPVGVHASGGRLIILGSGSTTGIHDAQYYYTTLRELDVSTGKYVANPAIDNQKWYKAYFRGRGPKLVNLDASVSGNPNDSFDTVLSYDLSTRQLQSSKVQLPPGFAIDYGDGIKWVFSGPDQMSAFLTRTSTTETCLVTIDLTGALLSSTCTPQAPWPVASGTNPSTLEMGRGPALIVEDPQHALAAWPDAPLHSADVVTLGSTALSPGLNEPPYSPVLLIHPNFDTYFGLQSGLADIPSTGTGRLLGMPSPCRDAHCGLSVSLVNLTPLDGGQYLGFWIVNSRLPDPGINGGPAWHQHVYARPVTLTEASSLGAPKATSLAGATGATAAGPVQAACVAANSCFLGVDYQIACMDYWSSLPDNNPGRIAFVAAANQGCPAVIDAWPDVARKLQFRGMLCNPVCFDAHTAMSCITSGGQSVDTPLDCRPKGLECGTTPLGFGCIDTKEASSCQECMTSGTNCSICTPEGVAIDCNRTTQSTADQACVALGGQCVVQQGQAGCTFPSCPSHCEGDVVIQCNGTQYSSRKNCADSGGTCVDPGNGQPPACQLVPAPAMPCNVYSPAMCQGPFGVFCNTLGQMESVDCTALGFTGCIVAGNQGMHCQ